MGCTSSLWFFFWILFSILHFSQKIYFISKYIILLKILSIKFSTKMVFMLFSTTPTIKKIWRSKELGYIPKFRFLVSFFAFFWRNILHFKSCHSTKNVPHKISYKRQSERDELGHWNRGGWLYMNHIYTYFFLFPTYFLIILNLLAKPKNKDHVSCLHLASRYCVWGSRGAWNFLGPRG